MRFGRREELGGVRADKTLIRIYFMKKSIFNKRKGERRKQRENERKKERKKCKIRHPQRENLKVLEKKNIGFIISQFYFKVHALSSLMCVSLIQQTPYYLNQSSVILKIVSQRKRRTWILIYV